jgi:hypothetical protein
MAAELISAYPDKSITIVTAKPTLLNKRYGGHAVKACHEFFTQRNVELITCDYAEFVRMAIPIIWMLKKGCGNFGRSRFRSAAFMVTRHAKSYIPSPYYYTLISTIDIGRLSDHQERPLVPHRHVYDFELRSWETADLVPGEAFCVLVGL